MGYLSPQLVASTTWDFRRLNWLPLLREALVASVGRPCHVGRLLSQLVASATWDFCSHSWSPLLYGILGRFHCVGFSYLCYAGLDRWISRLRFVTTYDDPKGYHSYNSL